MGMKDRRFSSSPSQLVNQEFDEIAITIPRIREAMNAIRLGTEFKMRKGPPPRRSALTVFLSC